MKLAVKSPPRLAIGACGGQQERKLESRGDGSPQTVGNVALGTKSLSLCTYNPVLVDRGEEYCRDKDQPPRPPVSNSAATLGPIAVA